MRCSLIVFVTFLLASCGKEEQFSELDKHQNVNADTAVFQCISSQSFCDIVTEYGKFSIKFDRGTILTELPFKIEIEHKGTGKVEKVSAYMEGKEMFMGKVPVFFSSTQKDTTVNQFVAESMLASCAEEFMTWRIHFSVEGRLADSEAFTTTFSIDFDTKRFD